MTITDELLEAKLNNLLDLLDRCAARGRRLADFETSRTYGKGLYEGSADAYEFAAKTLRETMTNHQPRTTK